MKPRANDEGGPCGVSIKKSTEGFEKKGEVFLIGVPAADGDNLILFLDTVSFVKEKFLIQMNSQL